MSWCSGCVVRMVVLVVFINDDNERRLKSLFVVWLPRRCERHGTWWVLVQSMTWRRGIVLEWEWRSRLVLDVLRRAVVVEGDW